MDPRTPYLSSNRNQRARVKAKQAPRVSSPVGAGDSTSVEDRWKGLGDPSTWARPEMQAAMPGMSAPSPHTQASALREAAPAAWSSLTGDARGLINAGYQAGGFEGVRNAVGADDWYALPSWLRTQILVGARG